MGASTTILRGGTVIDGTGSPGQRLDVAFAGGRVVEMAPTIRGDDEVDCTKSVVAPGFIDLHTHYDAQLLWDPACTSSSWHGVTSVVVGNCGFSLSPCPAEHRALMYQLLRDLEDMRPESLEAGIPWDFETFPEYLDVVRERGVDLNVAAYVGHSAVRIATMGADAFERAATDSEIEAMAAMVRDAMRAGAAGFATSTAPTGRNCPSRYATREESIALFRAMASTGRGVIATVPGGAMSHAEIYELQPAIGRPITWTALMSLPDGRHLDWMALQRAGWHAGTDVRPQVSCLPQGGRTTLAEPFALRCPAVRALDGAPIEARRRAYADPAWRARAADDLASSITPPRWDTWTVVSSRTGPELVGRSVESIAAERGTSGLELVLDLSLADDLTTWFAFTVANDDEAVVRELLALEGCVLGLSDAGAHPNQICDAVLPTDLLGSWVRDRGALDLAGAVRKLTGEIADLFGFADRGYLRPGLAADVVVFDPATVAPGPIRTIGDLPDGADRLIADRPTGVRHVFVNGVTLRRDEEQLDHTDDRRPGQVLVPTPA